MILACPACSATFKIPDGAIPPAGRKVRCAKCKNSWHTDPQTIARQQADLQQKAMAAQRPPAATAPAVNAAIARPPQSVPPQPARQQDVDESLAAQAVKETAALRQTVEDIGAKAEAERKLEDADTPLFDGEDSAIGTGRSSAENEFDEDLESVDTEIDYGDDDYDDDDFLTRRRADQRRQYERDAAGRQEKFILVGWIGLGLFWFITFYMFVFNSEWMLKNFPGTEAVYSTFSSMDSREMYRPEEGETLTPSKAEAEVYITAKLDPGRTKIDLVNGQEKLVVQGYVENLGETGAHVPQVLVQIVDSEGGVLDEWIVDPVGLIIRKNGRAPFTSIRDVPVGIANVVASAIEGSKSGTSGELR